MKKNKGGVIGILLAFVMVFAMTVPMNVYDVYAAGTEVQYTNDDYDGHNMKVTDGGEDHQVFCIAQGRPNKNNALSLSGVRIKYAWDADPAEYNAIANAGNSLMGGPYTYALSWAILGGMYTSEGNPRSDLEDAFTPMVLEPDIIDHYELS